MQDSIVYVAESLVVTSAMFRQPTLYLYFLCPGIDPFPQQPPARQAVAIVTEVGLILASHVDGNDCSGTHVPCNVRCWMRKVHTNIHTHMHAYAQTYKHSTTKSSGRNGKTMNLCFRTISVSLNLHLRSHNVQTDLHHKNISFLTCQTHSRAFMAN